MYEPVFKFDTAVVSFPGLAITALEAVNQTPATPVIFGSIAAIVVVF
jgi:hypothetical protein